MKLFFALSKVKRLKNYSTIVFLMLFCLLFSSVAKADGSSQKYNLKLKQVKITEALKEIKKITGYSFIFNQKLINKSKLVDLELENKGIKSVMDQCLDGTGLDYNIKNNIIVILKKQEPKKEKKPVRIKGVVKDDKGQTLPGVAVMVKGTTIGVSTNIDGKFSLDMPEGKTVIEFSFLGMKKKEYTIKDPSKDIIISMEEEGLGLDEVVVTGYTQTTTRKATGSVAVLKSEEFENKAVPNVDLLLQGKIAGVHTTAVSGRPGQSAKIRIRGTNTLTGNAEPLWVVDGVPLQRDIPKVAASQIAGADFESLFSNGVAGINPNDIETVTVLKDASASAIYGSRAAGGVIVITTKQGKIGKMDVNYSANFSITQKPIRENDLMNSAEKIEWEKEIWDEFAADKYAESIATSNPKLHYPVVGIVGMVRSGYGKYADMTNEEKESYLNSLKSNKTNWYDLLFRNSVSQSHYLSVSGGKDKFTYYLSMGASYNNGLVKKTDYSRYNVSSKFSYRPNDKLKISFSIDLSRQGSTGYISAIDPMTYAYFANPYEKAYNEDGSYKADETYTSLEEVNKVASLNYPDDGFNLLKELDLNKQTGTNTSVSVSSNLSYNINKDLYFSGVAAYSYTNDKSESLVHEDSYTAFMDRLSFDSPNQKKYGSMLNTFAFNSSYNLRGQLNYRKEILDGHKISLIAGSEIRGQKVESSYMKRYGYDDVTMNSAFPIPPTVDNKLGLGELITYANIVDGLSDRSISEETFASFYGAFDYNLMNKYNLSFTLRTDGSNNFGGDEQFNPTWSLGASWNIDEEEFFSSLKPWLSSLSLKLATGSTGNINKTISPKLIMTYNREIRRTESDNYRLGEIQSAPNPSLRWEKSQDYKIGLNYGLFNNKITGNFEYYYKLSKDVVSPVPVTYTTGYRQQSYNTSEIENQGIEASLNAQLYKDKDFNIRASANIAWNANKLKKYVKINPSYGGKDNVGYPLDAFIAAKYTGIDPDTGLYTFKQRPDAVIESAASFNYSENYSYYLGPKTAPINGGLSVNVSYKNFNLNIGGVFAFDKYISDFDNLKIASSAGSWESKPSNNQVPTTYNDIYYSHTNIKRELSDRWTPDNRDAKYPILIDKYGDRITDSSVVTYQHNRSITNAVLIKKINYLKINNLSLSYSLPEKYTKMLSVSSCSFSFSVNNLLTITNYDGIDPETPGAIYPIARTTSLGLSVNF
ncbi:MAG: SusC/RagA family TonB-linked outer membrane protein [Marinifilaceae bacterium]|nr:SusC/RagA family TonB-linked outer membrane protein [Marinifilaceae bacterium]